MSAGREGLPLKGPAVSSAAHLLGSKLGNFRLERVLGQGRMGVVYLARDEALLRPTAVKVLSWSLPEQHGLDPEAWFLAEARSVARINHPHVVQIYGVAKHGAHCYIAMEYVDGAAADRWIAEHGPFAPERATEILVQVAAALQAAHDAGLVHRDVKPENILIGSDGVAKLSDFGMAVHAAGKAANTGVRAGTPFYTAPEIWRGEHATPSTDLYALGATYFHLLTGHPPLMAKDLEGLIGAHLRGPVPDVESLSSSAPPGCNQIIQQCMAKTPEGRYSSARLLAWDARGLLRSMTARPARSVWSQRPAAPRTSATPATKPMYCEYFSFLREPFAYGEAAREPWIGEPFASVWHALGEWLSSPDECAALLVGDNGSGRTTMAQGVFAEYTKSVQGAFISCDEVSQAGAVQQQLLRAFGLSPPNRAKAHMDGLLEHLETTHGSEPRPALIVLDDATTAMHVIRELCTVIRAACLTKYLKVLILGPSELGRALDMHLASTPLALRRLQLPALSCEQAVRYVDRRLAASLPLGSARLLLTPDARLLLAYRAGGRLWRINRLATNMLRAAAHAERSVLSSWDSWCATEEESAEGAEACAPAPRPDIWPTPEVCDILNRCRAELGIAPRRTVSA